MVELTSHLIFPLRESFLLVQFVEDELRIVPATDNLLMISLSPCSHYFPVKQDWKYAFNGVKPSGQPLDYS